MSHLNPAKAFLPARRALFSLKEGEESWKVAKGLRKCITHPLIGTAVMVIIGCILVIEAIPTLKKSRSAAA